MNRPSALNKHGKERCEKVYGAVMSKAIQLIVRGIKVEHSHVIREIARRLSISVDDANDVWLECMAIKLGKSKPHEYN
ncbi:hypothetical protein VCHA53O466_140198 [Vibrio chagasii]|nr:hypothetical protein VCHA53O466_140198 [Vibrio chagasii]